MFKILTCIFCFAQTVFASCLENVKDNFDTIWSIIDKNLRDGISPNDVDIPVFKGGNSLYNGQLLYAALYNFIQSRSTQYAYMSVLNGYIHNLATVITLIKERIIERLKDGNSGLTDGAKSFLTESVDQRKKIPGNTLNLNGDGVVRPKIAIISEKTGAKRIVNEYIDNFDEDHTYEVVKEINTNDYDTSIIEDALN
ncbi:MAG: hypothetical protein IJ481_01905 [Alphaproteobacteria bacterium]|nr:hypothetical protein [Alphaproteobacteria bacterium]